MINHNPKSSSNILLNTPQLNKGTAFTKKERQKFNLLGKLPHRIETLNEQVIRAYEQFKSHESPIQKNLFLNELYNTNQVLAYKLISEHLEEMTPVIYTPHIATYCQTFSHEFRRPQGLYITYPDRKNLANILDNRPNKEIDLIVVTDGERILGIGDQGVGGIGIPIGKLMLYTLFGRINPTKTLPIVLDVGTNNKQLLADPMYLGWRHPRITGTKYNNFIDHFVSTIKQKLPNVFLHWEDFGKQNAASILAHYRKKICSFNDDIQGTAVVTLAAILAALKISKQKLTDQRIVFLGAGSAAIGIADLITMGMMREGLTRQDAQKCFWLLNHSGLITQQVTHVSQEQLPYARKIDEIKNWKTKKLANISLLDVIKNVKPTILIGCSTAVNSFTKEIVTQMAKHVSRPIIFPLSNPTANSEAKPCDLIKWTHGRALIATGSPFEPVIYQNKQYIITQCNNALAFPGIGLGVVATKTREVTNEMLWVAVKTLYRVAPCIKGSFKTLLPSIKDANSVAQKIAGKVAEIAIKNDLSNLPKNTNISKLITDTIWKIKYKKLNQI